MINYHQCNVNWSHVCTCHLICLKGNCSSWTSHPPFSYLEHGQYRDLALTVQIQMAGDGVATKWNHLGP